jgi:hypothetical protein
MACIDRFSPDDSVARLIKDENRETVAKLYKIAEG